MSETITIYGKDNCPFCVQAKALVELYGWDYVYKDVLAGDTGKELMTRLPTARSVPQIFVGEEHIGGFTHLRDKVGDGTLIKRLDKETNVLQEEQS